MSPLSLVSSQLFLALSWLPETSLGYGGGPGRHPSPPSPVLTCKAVPGSADWPSQRAWGDLDAALGRRLLQPAPPGAVCHPGQPAHDSGKCAAVASEWSSYDFHAGDPVSVMWNQFGNDSCLPDPDYPCSNSGYPVFVVNATTPAHVKLGVDFARKNNVRLVVKGTGHDYIGRSIAPNSLSIWTHHMQGIQFHAGSFKPKGCGFRIPGNAVTAAAGSEMRDLYEQLDLVNETVVGGGAWSVGVGGYLTGGGHSILAPRYGMAADQVLEVEMVTPGGSIVTANECQNKDLFWAMRGGGGSTFGVLTSVTMKTYPSPKMLHMDFVLVGKVADPRVWDYVAYFLSQFPTLESRDISGYMVAFPSYPNPFPVGDPFVAGVFGRAVLQDTLDDAEMLARFAPIVEHINQTWPGAMTFYNSIEHYDSFLDWYKVKYDQGEAGHDTYLASRLLDGKALTGNLTALRDAVEYASIATGGISTFLVSGRGVHNAKPRGGSNAVNPAWRTAFVHAITAIAFPPLNATAKAEAIANVNATMEPLRELAPDMGAYINEAFPFEPDWQHAFWGSNYERLARIKRAADPHDVLWCTPCVGNERWKEVGDRLCKV